MNPTVFQINNITRRNNISGMKIGRRKLFSSFINGSSAIFTKNLYPFRSLPFICKKHTRGRRCMCVCVCMCMCAPTRVMHVHGRMHGFN